MTNSNLEIAKIVDRRTGRTSSWDQRGRNQDYWVVAPGESRVLADLEGPGCVTHIWLTQFCRKVLGPGLIDPLDSSSVAPVNEIANALGIVWEEADPDYYRKILFKVTYDNAEYPSILVPLGDFFGVGNSIPNSYQNEFFSVTVKPEESLKFGGSASLNCYLPMPFRKNIRIEIINQGELPYGQYFHVDYELRKDDLSEDVGYLHAKWNRSKGNGWGPDMQVNSPEQNVAHATGDGNYVLLDTEGAGRYVGCNLSVFHRQGSWWGEGDEMFFIDDDTWPPTIHGTGTEDYFNHAWGMQNLAYRYNGAIVHDGEMPGYAVSYRFHAVDPVRFSKRIKVSMEHGHANHLSDDWSSTAYWYASGRPREVSVLPVEERLPIRATVEAAPAPVDPPAAMEAEVKQARKARDDREATFRKRYVQRINEASARSKASQEANRKFAQDLSGRFRQ